MKISKLLLLIILFLIGCDSVYKIQNKEERKIYLVFCDITSSTDSTSIKLLARNAQQILRCSPDGTVLKFYPIDGITNSPALLEFTKPSNAYTASQTAQNESLSIRASNYLWDIILERYKQLNSDATFGENDPARSCIVNTLSTAYSILKNYRKKGDTAYDFKLIYLSDMIEQCESSPVDHIDLTKLHFDSALKNIKDYNPSFDLSFVNISIILSAEFDEKASKIYDPDDLKLFWEQIFTKVGYTKDQFQHFSFSTEIPPELRCTE